MKRLRAVRTLKLIKKPFAIWPLITALTGRGKALIGFSKNGSINSNQLRRPIPAYAIVLVLLLGLAGGAYAATSLSHGTLAQASSPDFSVTMTPPSFTASRGSLATFTVALSSLNGFAGSVNLNATTPLAGMSVAVNPDSVSLLIGKGTSTLTIFVPVSTPTGTYTVNMTGSSGKLSHATPVFLLVASPPPADFTLAANSTTVNVSQGSSATASLLLSSVSGFSGNVNLLATVSPVIANGPTATLNPATVTLTSGGTANSLLTISTSGLTPLRSYSIFVLATSGTFSHSVSISLTVQ